MRGLVLALLLATGLAGAARGHAMPNSRVELQRTTDGVEAKVAIPLSELEAGLGAPVTLDEPGRGRLEAYLRAHAAVLAADGQALPMTVVRLEADRGDHAALLATLRFSGRADGATLRYDAVTHRIASHYVLVYWGGRPLTRLQLPQSRVTLPR